MYDTEKKITQAGLENSSAKLLQKGDLIISARGTVGALAQLKKPMAFNQSCYGIREIENVSDNDFLYYLVKYSVGKILKNVHGAVFDTVTRQTFENINISLPSLPEQRAIAAVLSSLDDKIELLREQNKTLEKTAQAIFRERFGKYSVERPEEFPGGWRVGKLGGILHLQGGFVHDTKASGKNMSKIAKMGVVDGKSWFNRNSVIEYSEKINDKHKLKEDDLIVCTRDVTQDRVVIGNVAIAPPDLAKEGLYAGSNTWIIKTNYNKYFLFLLFRDQVFRNHIIQSSKGSTIVMITKDAFLDCEVVIPGEKFLANFTGVITPIFERIKNNSQQIQTLSTLRDSLLPRLMRGEVRVKF